MAGRGPEWNDFQEIRETIRSLTVEKLKTIFGHIEEELGQKVSKQGNKSVLIDRLQKVLDTIYEQKLEESFSIAKSIIRSVRTYGHYQPTGGFRPAMPTGTYPSTHSTYHPYPGLSSNNLPSRPSYNPYAASNHGAGTSTSSHGGVNGAVNGAQANSRQIRFKPSPFYRVDQPLHQLVVCQENKDGSERRSQYFTFTLNQDQSEKLQSKKYQVRLYCTSSTHYAPNSFTNAPVPIEFPPTCEIRVNNKNINANVRGLKKKPGTAPPPNLTPFMSTAKGVMSKVELIYVNNITPFVSKKFYMIAQLVEVTTVQEVVNKLKAGKQRSKEDVLQSMKKAAMIDADIEAGPQKMSLKCPASYIRINTPCRSSTCVHPQCFDAENWFSMMEQTTTWACPVCDKALNTEELIIDMYFDDILKCTPESVEDVIVEANGEWHTEDDKHGSQGWMSTAASRPRPVEKVKTEPETKPLRESSADAAKPKPAAEFLVLDSDDDDDDDDAPPPRAPVRDAGKSVVHSSSSPSRPVSQVQTAVIDLTLSSDDEGDDPPPAPRPSAPSTGPSSQEAASAGFKRKERASTPQDAAWKRPRVEHPANGFMGVQNDDNRPPTREEPRIMRSDSRPPVPNQYSHPSYSHSPPSTAGVPGRAPDYSGAGYGYGQHPNAHHGMTSPVNQYPPRYNPNGYPTNGRYPAYGAPAYPAEPTLPFTANGRAHPTLPRPHPNPGPGAQSGNNNRGDVWY